MPKPMITPTIPKTKRLIKMEEEEKYQDGEKCPICNKKMATNNKFCSLKCYEEFENK